MAPAAESIKPYTRNAHGMGIVCEIARSRFVRERVNQAN